mmetsp:Transcript_20609/g.61704  ORF Transcript_20609/g.61704 Transcript_20609/m.61704 type:complete len:353 (-) Transcript_20609:437-1495(-)
MQVLDVFEGRTAVDRHLVVAALRELAEHLANEGHLRRLQDWVDVAEDRRHLHVEAAHHNEGQARGLLALQIQLRLPAEEGDGLAQLQVVLADGDAPMRRHEVVEIFIVQDVLLLGFCDKIVLDGPLVVVENEQIGQRLRLVALHEVHHELDTPIAATTSIADEKVVHALLVRERLDSDELVQLGDDLADARVSEHGEAILVGEEGDAELDERHRQHGARQPDVVVVDDWQLGLRHFHEVEVFDILHEVTKAEHAPPCVPLERQGLGHRPGERVAVGLLHHCGLGAGLVAPEHLAPCTGRLGNVVEDDVLVHAVNVLLLRAQWEHAHALANDDEAVFLEGVLEALAVVTDGIR